MANPSPWSKRKKCRFLVLITGAHLPHKCRACTTKRTLTFAGCPEAPWQAVRPNHRSIGKIKRKNNKTARRISAKRSRLAPGSSGRCRSTSSCRRRVSLRSRAAFCRCSRAACASRDRLSLDSRIALTRSWCRRLTSEGSLLLSRGVTCFLGGLQLFDPVANVKRSRLRFVTSRLAESPNPKPIDQSTCPKLLRNQVVKSLVRWCHEAPNS